MIRIERDLQEFVDFPTRRLSAEVSDQATIQELGVRLRQLEDAAKKIEDACPHCYAGMNMVHDIACPYAPDDQRAACREHAISEGMRT